MREILTSKYLRSWNLHPESNLAITFGAILLMISFEDLILIFFIWVPITTIEGTLEKSNISKTLPLLLGVQLKTLSVFMVLVYRSTSIYLTVLAPQ